MAAARRSAGSGTVVALVIFIVLTFVAIGASIWLYQQFSTMQQSVTVNQDDFKKTVGKMFDAHVAWKLTADTSPEYDLRYGKEAYEDVKEQLDKAARYDELKPVLGWESIDADSVKARKEELSETIKEDVVEPYETIKELLEHYETKYKEKDDRITQLETELAEKTKELAAEREKFQQELVDQLDAYTKRNTKHTATEGRSTKRYTDFLGMYEKFRKETRETERELEATKKAHNSRVAEMTGEQDKLKKVIKKLRPVEKADVTMKPEGKVLRVDTAYNFIKLAGGEDMGRKKNERFVIYSQVPSGARTKKGEVVVSKVYPITSLAIIVSAAEEMMEKDLYVSKQEWEKFEGPRVEEVEVAVQKEAEAAPKEEEEKEEEPPEDVGWGTE